MRKSVLNTALSTAFIVALGFGISACSGDKEGESHEVLAIERVDEAAALARANAPAAEDIDFPETAPTPVAEADGTAVESAATTDAAATTGVATTEAETTGTDMAEATTTDGADASMAGTDSAGTDSADTAVDGAAAQ